MLPAFSTDLVLVLALASSSSSSARPDLAGRGSTGVARRGVSLHRSIADGCLGMGMSSRSLTHSLLVLASLSLPQLCVCDVTS